MPPGFLRHTTVGTGSPSVRPPAASSDDSTEESSESQGKVPSQSYSESHSSYPISLPKFCSNGNALHTDNVSIQCDTSDELPVPVLTAPPPTIPLIPDASQQSGSQISQSMSIQATQDAPSPPTSSAVRPSCDIMDQAELERDLDPSCDVELQLLGSVASGSLRAAWHPPMSLSQDRDSSPFKIGFSQMAGASMASPYAPHASGSVQLDDMSQESPDCSENGEAAGFRLHASQFNQNFTQV